MIAVGGIAQWAARREISGRILFGGRVVCAVITDSRCECYAGAIGQVKSDTLYNHRAPECVGD